MSDDVHWMGQAIELAQEAFDHGEVPVGAVVVREQTIVGRGHNRTEQTGYPFEHAEMVALWDAVGRLGTRYLDDCVLYSTVEPCVMCVGAAILARIPRIVFGAREPVTGACESLFAIPNEPGLERRIVSFGGVEADRAAGLMRAFFRSEIGET